MRTITLIRHGKAAAGWEDADPPLDDTGHAQAEAMAALVGSGPRPLFTSPLRRTRDTAKAIERVWDVTAVVEPGVGEVQAPMEGLAERVAWIGPFLRGTYSEAGAVFEQWRDSVLGVFGSLPNGAVVVSHFVAINTAIGKAWADDRVTCHAVGNCSLTVIEIDDATDGWRVVSLGDAASTFVN